MNSVDISYGWQFNKPNEKPEEVNLPHSWNAQDTFQEGRKYYRGKGRYRKKLKFTEQANVIHLVCEGFYGSAILKINGRQVGEIDGQFLGFREDITVHVDFEKDNHLELVLSNKHKGSMLPGIKEPDFVLHGGLAGRMSLEYLPAEHLPRDQIFIETISVSTAEASIKISGVEAASLKILDPSGSPVFDGETEKEICIKQPGLWSIDNPQLYTAVFSVAEDELQLPFGIREAEFRSEAGFFLNGERITLKGINRHENMPGFGSALPLEMHRYDAQLIKDAGFNLVRLSHYPQHPEFLKACDELGILVYAEICTWKSVKRGRWLKNACTQMRAMIRRDRNHPSVILWGMGNESQDKVAFDELKKVIAEEDPGRPSIYAENHQYRAKRNGTLKLPDVMGVNYELEVLEEACQNSANQVLLMSELSNVPKWRGDIAGEQEQLETIEADVAAAIKYPFVAGYCLWCFADYATMRKKRYRRPSGIFDAWRIPKLSASKYLGKELPSLNPAEISVSYEGERFIVVDIVAPVDHLEAKLEGNARASLYDEAGTVMLANMRGRIFIEKYDDSVCKLTLSSTFVKNWEGEF